MKFVSLAVAALCSINAKDLSPSSIEKVDSENTMKPQDIDELSIDLDYDNLYYDSVVPATDESDLMVNDLTEQDYDEDMKR
jgi:hypothetical protein